MTSRTPDQPAAAAAMDDQQLAEALLRDLTCILELDAGLRDVLAHAGSDRLLLHLSDVLDLDTGLQAILPPDLAQPMTTQARPTPDPPPARFRTPPPQLNPLTRLMTRRSAPGAAYAITLRRVTTILHRLATYRDRRELATLLSEDLAELEAAAAAFGQHAGTTHLS